MRLPHIRLLDCSESRTHTAKRSMFVSGKDAVLRERFVLLLKTMSKDRDRPRCVDCGSLSPATETNFTLIGSNHGWRLTMTMVGGRKVPVWRCPRCWKKHKEGSDS